MVCDGAPSLSLQRMQLSDDEGDFSWGRWYWCQAGALPLPLMEAYVHPMWRTDEGDVPTGPGFRLQAQDEQNAGRMAAVVRVQSVITQYAGSRVSPFPGLHKHGPDQWYQDGLPPGVGRDWLPGYDGGPVGEACGAEHWQTDALVPLGVETGEPDGVSILSGGGEGGGTLGGGVACRIFLGACLHGAGGGGGGGSMPASSSSLVPLSGGGAGGGLLAHATGAAVPLEGGGEGGGGLPSAPGAMAALSGGGEGGGLLPASGGGGDDMPVGAIYAWAPWSGSIPANALVCDGAAYLQADYPDLYAVIGGDWDTFRGYDPPAAGSFRVPRLSGVVIGAAGAADGGAPPMGPTSAYDPGDAAGQEGVTLGSGEMPAHTHTLTDPGHTHSVASGNSSNLVTDTLTLVAAADFLPTTSGSSVTGVSIDSAGGGAAHENRQPTVYLRYLIVATL